MKQEGRATTHLQVIHVQALSVRLIVPCGRMLTIRTEEKNVYIYVHQGLRM